MSHYDDADLLLVVADKIIEANEGGVTSEQARALELYLLQAQVRATLALVDVQREATEHAKTVVDDMRTKQEEFQASVLNALKED